MEDHPPDQHIVRNYYGRELGKGTYGVVYLGKREGLPSVALKKFKNSLESPDGIDFTAIREIKLLQELKSPYIVELIEVFTESSFKVNTLWLVYEYMETDLAKVIKNLSFNDADIKSYMFMMLKGLEYLHNNWVVHRDLSPGNLLISSEGYLKVGDYSLAKKFGEDVPLTPTVVTRWYRAPELLFGATHYGVAVDMWSVGCIFAELIYRIAYFPGDNEIDQLGKIFAALGTPKEEDWPGLSELPLGYIKFTPSEGSPFEVLFKGTTDDAIHLISGLLKLDPRKRLTATAALEHHYFKSLPIMTPPEKLPLQSRKTAPPLQPKIEKEVAPVTIKQDSSETEISIKQEPDTDMTEADPNFEFVEIKKEPISTP